MSRRRRGRGPEAGSRDPAPSRRQSCCEEALLHTTPAPGAFRAVAPRDRLLLVVPPNSRMTAKSPGRMGQQCPPQARRRKHPPQASTSTDLSNPLTPWGVPPLSESCCSIPSPQPACPALLASASPSGQHEDDVGGGGPRPSVRTAPPQRVDRFRGGRCRPVPQYCPPRASLLPPLQPITNLSFSRSFTFSFFELPLHRLSRRADHVRDLSLLLRKVQL
ncbi:WAS/WASL-interacting protein family member 3-like [Arapaima gigas]